MFIFILILWSCTKVAHVNVTYIMKVEPRSKISEVSGSWPFNKHSMQIPISLSLNYLIINSWLDFESLKENDIFI